MSDQTKDDFIEICKSFDNAMLVTQGAQHELFARPMMVAELENNGDLWFASDRNSGMVDEILTHPQVCVTLAGNDKFASISGHAEVIKDRPHVDRLWSERWRTWFPEGPTDPRIVLLRVHASSGEFWSNSGANRIKHLFDAAKAYISGQHSSTNDTQHSHVDLG